MKTKIINQKVIDQYEKTVKAAEALSKVLEQRWKDAIQERETNKEKKREEERTKNVANSATPYRGDAAEWADSAVVEDDRRNTDAGKQDVQQEQQRWQEALKKFDQKEAESRKEEKAFSDYNDAINLTPSCALGGAVKSANAIYPILKARANEQMLVGVTQVLQAMIDVIDPPFDYTKYIKPLGIGMAVVGGLCMLGYIALGLMAASWKSALLLSLIATPIPTIVGVIGIVGLLLGLLVVSVSSLLWDDKRSLTAQEKVDLLGAYKLSLEACLAKLTGNVKALEAMAAKFNVNNQQSPASSVVANQSEVFASPLGSTSTANPPSGNSAPTSLLADQTTVQPRQ